MATDAFTGTNGTELPTYSANWSLGNALSSDFVIDTNSLRTPFSRAISLHAYRNDGSFANDQYAEAKIVQVGSASQYMGVCVRSGNGDAYAFVVDGINYLMWKLIGYGGYTQLAFAALAVVAGDTIRLEASGTTLTAKLNGSTVTTVTDSALTSGRPGVAGQGGAASGTYTLLDDWVGDDLTAAALQFWQYRWPHQLHARR